MISGAVMFLFEGQFGAILHTGDCRLTSDCVQNLPTKYIAKKGNENICRLDFVFLDCTFSKCFLKLPSKESAIHQVALSSEIRYAIFFLTDMVNYN
jgi:DNA cross-link repair 1A protein